MFRGQIERQKMRYGENGGEKERDGERERDIDRVEERREREGGETKGGGREMEREEGRE